MSKPHELKSINDLIFEYINRGFSVVPIMPGTKRPAEFIQGKWQGLFDWEKYVKGLAISDELERWRHWPLEAFGLCTGELSGVIALDFDNRPEIGQLIQNEIPISPCRKVGQKGYTAFYRFNGECNRKWSINREVVIELLSNGRQTVMPPSVHPTGLIYEWQSEKTLLDVERSELPIIESIEIIERIINEHKPQQRVFSTGSMCAPSNATHFEQVTAALEVIPADDYDQWIKIGMALHSEFPGIEGFSLWDSWSKKSAKYEPSEMGKKWASFAKVHNVKIASVFYEAKNYGYINNNSSVGYQTNGYIPSYINSELPFENETISQNDSERVQQSKQPMSSGNVETFQPSIPRELLENAPGLVGEIAAWINETSIFHQPALALGASLAAVGALKAHRVRTESNLRTNLYIIGLVPSGLGKGRAMEQIESLFFAAGLESLFSGEPVSDSAVLKSLRNNKGRRLLQWDEVGIAISEMTNTRSANHKTAILNVMMKLFSKASSVYFGKEYADHDDKMKRKDIDQPCLCLYGASTKNRVYGALTSSYVVDGFISRFIIIEPEQTFPERQRVSIGDVPENLIQKILQIEDMPVNSSPRGNLDQHNQIRPRIVFLEPEAERMLAETQEFYDRQVKYYLKTIEGVSAVWARGVEHVLKVALTVEDSETITAKTFDWARRFVTCCVQHLAKVVVERIADNEQHRNVNRVLETVKAMGQGGINKSSLIRATRWLKNYEREDILKSLVEANEIEAFEVKGRTKNQVLYIATLQ
jgi:hypothetical protein